MAPAPADYPIAAPPDYPISTTDSTDSYPLGGGGAASNYIGADSSYAFQPSQENAYTHSIGGGAPGAPADDHVTGDGAVAIPGKEAAVSDLSGSNSSLNDYPLSSGSDFGGFGDDYLAQEATLSDEFAMVSAESVVPDSAVPRGGSRDYPLNPPAIAAEGAYPAYPGRPAPVQENYPAAADSSTRGAALNSVAPSSGAASGPDRQPQGLEAAPRRQNSQPQPRPAQQRDGQKKPADKQYLAADFFQNRKLSLGKKLDQGRVVEQPQAPAPSQNANSRPAAPIFEDAAPGHHHESKPEKRENSVPDFFDMSPSTSAPKGPPVAPQPVPPPAAKGDQGEDFLSPAQRGKAKRLSVQDVLEPEKTPARKSGRIYGVVDGSEQPKAESSLWVTYSKVIRSVLCVLVGSLVIVVIAGVVMATQKTHQTAALSVEGIYKTVRRDNKGATVTGTISLERNGNLITGTGIQVSDRFTASGTVDESNKFAFQEVFLNPDGSVSQRYAPINVEGQLATGRDFAGNEVRSLVGTCSAASTGGSLMSRIRSFRCQWIATEDGTSNKWSPLKWLTDPAAPLPPKLFALLFACITGGLVLVIASFKIFGPNGLLNVKEKKKYIPAQVQSDHEKILKELGAPPKPGGLPLGLRKEWSASQSWLPKNLAIPPERRKKNPTALVLGGSQGKSRLIESMIRHDILSDDRAVVVIDSEGGLVDRLIYWIASQKGKNVAALHARVRVVDPLAANQTYGFNPIAAVSAADLNQLAASVVTGFRCIYMEAPGAQNQWNQQTANILRNSIILLGLNGKSLGDLPRLLSDNDFRDLCLANVEANNQAHHHDVLLEAWVNYKRLARTEQWITWIEPIINRLQPVLADSRIRRLLCDKRATIEPVEILEERQILLVRIPRSRLEQGSALLGSLIVTGLRHAAVKLSDGKEENPSPCALYVDEMSDFVDKDCFESIAGDTRQLQIGLTGVMRSLQTVPEDFRNSLSKSIGILVTFALTRKDAELVGPQMFRVDGKKPKIRTITNLVNQVNTSPTFELISDEEKLNIDRLTGQEEKTFFCYLVGSIAGVFQLKAPIIEDVPRDSVDRELVDELYVPVAEEAT